MLTVVSWLWQSSTCTAKYLTEYVNVWARMIDRNLTLPHRLMVITDRPYLGFDPLIEPVKLWDDYADLKKSNWPERKPNCYRRLKAFSREMREIVGDRFVSMDLDVLVTSNLDPIFDRVEDFLILRRYPPDAVNTYQGSLWMMTAGARAGVWENFRGSDSAELTRAWIGTDQAWIRYKLGPDEAGWTDKDGVYHWPQISLLPRYHGGPPENARLIVSIKPWEFASTGPPRCPHCDEILSHLEPPWELKRGPWNPPSHPWVRKYWR